MRRPTPCFVCLAFCGLVSASSMAAEAPDQFTTSLFDGQTLAGWHVTGCEASVKDGAIFLKARNGLLRTDARYTDFVLELEWKALRPDRWDSGIYFRAELPPEGVPWPKRYQANLLKGMEGNVGGLEGAASEGLTKPGEWNHFKLSVVGTTAAMEINCRGTDYRVTHNGIVVVDATAAEFPELSGRRLTGFLGLQNHSEEVYFRNLRIGSPQP